ncbi:MULTISPECIES: hypothetical protein [Pseudoalteromonas]|jgi:hypothetical protein|uniref:Uncharacterized protein n=2 Tax=Pseudoalteromonas TaxID=53246 RepID=A0A290SA92_9GAMM|nr:MULTISPECIES: hypothetical protein [Pseudoalteromonas]OUX96063.1 MAG: hypothetical protein CBC03_00260 [Pseudoalteromonas sp. TMED43]ATC89006.1 hypothetical protein PARC_p0033 [Pseudoalteromonas arctica A 37-1-2]AYM89031.1 hypothetical protein D9T18_20275 [Pseudoalteromonas agarivorans]MBE0421216.1 hypothetical protein [Pseudoalteromonas nigrifaciens]MDC9566732.1 hypothetical protein [Pseudoalteromonas sp. GAB2316C]|tara:strand:+ start:4072 stop:4791 length:720 start_codon:yes stop_codon:yes gene_type:complete
MLKNQDLLVVLKVLSFEESSHESLSLTRELQGEAWVHLGNDVEKISQYDIKQEELVVSNELEDFDLKELSIIDEFLQGSKYEFDNQWTYRKLAQHLFISLSEANNAVKRSIDAGLLFRLGSKSIKVNRTVLVNFIRYGAGVSFYTEPGRIVRGIPTSYAAPVFKEIFASSNVTPPVWPCARGTAKGVAIDPLYKSVTKAVMIDSWLYQQLALVDIFRIGTAREREQALPFLEQLNKGKI